MTSHEQGAGCDPDPRDDRLDHDAGRDESYPSHETHMRQLGDRVRWLSTHRHWWLRTTQGRSQLEFIQRRDVA